MILMHFIRIQKLYLRFRPIEYGDLIIYNLSHVIDLRVKL